MIVDSNDEINFPHELLLTDNDNEQFNQRSKNANSGVFLFNLLDPFGLIHSPPKIVNSFAKV